MLKICLILHNWCLVYVQDFKSNKFLKNKTKRKNILKCTQNTKRISERKQLKEKYKQEINTIAIIMHKPKYIRS